MKTMNLTLMNCMKKLILMGVIMLTWTRLSLAQNAIRQNDPYFPAKNKFSAGILTSYRGSSKPAPAIIGEFTYGLSNRTSVGIMAGTTGSISLIAGKLATVITQHNNFRLLYRMTIIYYPERNGTYLFDNSNQHIDPWMLSMGLVDAEWKMKSGLRWSIGMGLLETHCVDGMMILLRGETKFEDADDMFEWFHTIQTSLSIPLSKKFTLRPEVITIWDGAKLVSGEGHKVIPLNIYAHLVYTF